MRITMLVANPITYDGRVVRNAQTLVEAGHEVTVIGVIGPNDRLGELPEGIGFRALRIDRRRRGAGLGASLRWAHSALRRRVMHRLCGLLSDRALERLPVLPALAEATSGPELALAALRTAPQVLHANDLNTLPAAAWAGRLLGVPYVYDAHELYPDEQPDMPALDRRVRWASEEHYARGAAAVLTVNDLLADEIAKRYGVPRPVVLRNVPRPVAVTPPDERPLGAADSLHLLHHGAHIGLEHHGTPDILRAMALCGPGLDLRLTLRGGLSAAGEAALRARLDELALSRRVRIFPPVAGAEALVRAAAEDGADLGLAVHPGSCLSFRYASSSKIFEYQAAGLAVCATDLLGNRVSAAAAGAVFFPEGDAEALAAHFRVLAGDRHRLRAMQRAAYAFAQAELRWDKERERLLDVYRDLDERRDAAHNRTRAV